MLKALVHCQSFHNSILKWNEVLVLVRQANCSCVMTHQALVYILQANVFKQGDISTTGGSNS